MPIVPLGHNLIKFNQAQKFSESSIEIDSELLKRLCDAVALLNKNSYYEMPVVIFWQLGMFKMSFWNGDCQIIKTLGRSDISNPEVLAKMPEWRLRFSGEAFKKQLSTFKKNVKVVMFEEEQGWTNVRIDGGSELRFPTSSGQDDGLAEIDCSTLMPVVLMNYSEFIEAIDTVEDFTNNKGEHPEEKFSWIYLEVKNERVKFSATDGKRAITHSPKTQWATDAECLTYVPLWLRKPLKLLFMSKSSDKDCVVKIIPTKNEEGVVNAIVIATADTAFKYWALPSRMLTHTQIADIFTGILVESTSSTVTIARDDFERFIKIAKPFIESLDPVELHHEDGKWRLSRSSSLGTMNLAIQPSDDRGPLRNGLLFKVSGDFLKDAIQSIYKKEKGENAIVRITYQVGQPVILVGNHKTDTIIYGMK